MLFQCVFLDLISHLLSIRMWGSMYLSILATTNYSQNVISQSWLSTSTNCRRMFGQATTMWEPSTYTGLAMDEVDHTSTWMIDQLNHAN